MDIIKYITALGSIVVLPIIIFILGLVFGDRPGRALRSGITVGVGFVGLGLVITLLITNLSPVTEALIKRTGLQLGAMDVGWPVAAAIAFGTYVGAIIVPIAFLWNVVLLAFRGTKTLNVDIWNFWHYAFTGSLVVVVTGNITLGVIAALFHATLALKIADITAKRIQDFFGLPGVSIPQGFAVTTVPVVLAVNRVIDWIPGLRNVKADPETIQKRLGTVGDPLFLGAVLGILMGILGGYDVVKTLQLAVSLAAVMLLMPRIIGIFMEGLVPFSEAARKFMKQRFVDREVYIGLDSAILIGHPITVAVGILLIPTVLFLAAVLPGNKTLPFADLAATAFFVAYATPLTRGNLVRTYLMGVVVFTIVLYLTTAFAPLLTQTVRSIGFALPESAKQATSITALSGGNLFAWLAVMAAKISSGVGLAVLLALSLLFMWLYRPGEAPKAPKAPMVPPPAMPQAPQAPAH
jgi:PTS system galactitol-specific IIC component